MTQTHAIAFAPTMAAPSAPSRLILLLLDAALVSMSNARQAIRDDDAEKREVAASLTTEIVGQLYLALDTEGGGAVADNMARIYGFILRMLPRVNRLADLEAANEVLRVLAPLRDAWLAVNDNQAQTDDRWRGGPKSVRSPMLDA